MLAVVAPVLHRYVTPALALADSVAVNAVQLKSLLTATLTVGRAVSLTTVVVVAAVQPLVLVTVTEYGPALLTVIVGVVAPVLHRYVKPAVAVVEMVAVG